MKKLIVATLFATVGLTSCNTQSTSTEIVENNHSLNPEQKVINVKLDSLFNILTAKNKMMGSVTISKNGEIVYKRTIGYSSIESTGNKLATDETKYQIGSVTKMFTATIIFQLIDENKLSLDTKLSTFFPEIPNSKLISIKELLNHRSGLYDFVNDQDDFMWITKPQSKQTLLNIIQNGKSNFTPITKMSYSNSGYLLLGYIIEVITKQSYNGALQNRICSKIELNKTFATTLNETQKTIATSYEFDKNWKKITDIYFPNVVGVGDIISTPSELILFNEALLNGKLVSEKSLGFMKTFDDETFGMGMMKIHFGKKIALGHGGDTYGTHSLVSTFEKEKLSMAFCINGEVESHTNIAIGILSICFNEPYKIPTFNATLDCNAPTIVEH